MWVGTVGAALPLECWFLGFRAWPPLLSSPRCCFRVLLVTHRSLPLLSLVTPSNQEASGRISGGQSRSQRHRSLKEMQSGSPLEAADAGPSPVAAKSTKLWEKLGLSDRPGKAKTCFV